MSSLAICARDTPRTMSRLVRSRLPCRITTGLSSSCLRCSSTSAWQTPPTDMWQPATSNAPSQTHPRSWCINSCTASQRPLGLKWSPETGLDEGARQWSHHLLTPALLKRPASLCVKGDQPSLSLALHGSSAQHRHMGSCFLVVHGPPHALRHSNEARGCIASQINCSSVRSHWADVQRHGPEGFKSPCR